eukprot:m.32453 g.32453  ORF g.32453 m.32453 type:complete len:430 (+) comp8413_c0_seq2:117-1406(+)
MLSVIMLLVFSISLFAQGSANCCRMENDTDYDHGGEVLKQINNITIEQCCEECRLAESCGVAVYSASYDIPPHACFLKRKGAVPSAKQGVHALFPTPKSPPCYSAELVGFDMAPVVSAANGTSTFAQVFNPSWIVGSEGTSGKAGLLIRSQNCTSCSGCCRCSGTDQKASKITFAKLLSPDGSLAEAPRFEKVTGDSVVFGPQNNTDIKGTEDPRVAYDNSTGLYYMFYTCYGVNNVELCLATSKNPTASDGWTRHGSVGFGQGSKSAALLIRDEPPHYLIWGAGKIRITSSSNLLKWSPGKMFITDTPFNPNVEAGPPPMKLPSGDYIFFHNSWDKNDVYKPTWVVLSGKDPTNILARGQTPLWTPDKAPWMEGKAPYGCNVPNVAFLEAAHVTENPNIFRVYFGGSDNVIGSALVKVTKSGTCGNCG